MLQTSFVHFCASPRNFCAVTSDSGEGICVISFSPTEEFRMVLNSSVTDPGLGFWAIFCPGVKKRLSLLGKGI